MGGSSKSSTTTKTTQTVTNETANADASGVITGNVIQGENTFYDYFPDNVAGAFEQLVGLANKSLDLTERAGSAALEQVSTRFEQGEQPELSIVRDLIPVLMIGSVGLVAYLIFKR